jgi:hypothetical protein
MPSQESWNLHKATIYNLYVEQKKPLSEVIAVLKTKGFYASESQYKRQFPKWNIRKNLTADSWKYIGRTLRRYHPTQSTSTVLYYGREIPSESLQKGIRRNNLPKFIQSPTPERDQGIEFTSSGPGYQLTIQSSPTLKVLEPIIPQIDYLPTWEMEDIVDQKGMALNVYLAND